ncbi:Ig-like domain-containing protein [Blastopirellula marina]|uniref:peptidylprolyl isomerase n=1 Tax=Blastopirellula marina TaxID=124 RepID=A0A2S8GUQ3_9BACT|nr:Ig-like domain-containing protein [Blastopirellula marina]PQO48165.1 hypothetical protein C5Y93_00340 [Blastopirellula marina]
MTELFVNASNTATLAILLGVGLITMMISALAWKRRSLRLAPALARKTRRGSHGQRIVQQLESRELMDAGMGNQSLPIEGESITVGGVTYENVDLIALAKAIADSGTILYGASWCPHCADQKAIFGDAKSYLPYVEVSTPSHQPNAIGQANNITKYPTWVFSDGRREARELSLEELITFSGITVPQGEALYLEPIQDQTESGAGALKAGQSYHIPLDGYSPSGQPLTYTVTTSHGSIETKILDNNRSLRVSTVRFGDMEFYLFEDEAGIVTSRIIELAEAGSYDNMLFHRVIDNFVIQAGQVTDGSSPAGMMDTFDSDLRNNRTGMLALAKTPYDDSGTSQFYVIEGDQGYLDFNYPVFGVLTEGEWVREMISGTPTPYSSGSTNDSSKRQPIYDVKVDKVTVFDDAENAVLRIKVPENLPAGETVTVTVSDGQGNTVSRTFKVEAKADTADYKPFLSYIPDVTLKPGGSASFKLDATSVDGDNVLFYKPQSTATGLSFTINQNTGQVAINASAGLAPGVYYAYVGVYDEGTTLPTRPEPEYQLTVGSVDFQRITITIANPSNLYNDTVNLNEDSFAVFEPLANDSGANGDLVASTLRVVTPPVVGELSFDKTTGKMTYTPPADYYGTVSFQYTVANEYGLGSLPATVTLVVAPVNDAPTAFDDVFHADRDAATLLPILKNDQRGPLNEQNDPMIVVLPTNTSNAGGTVVVLGDQIQYIPAAGFTGTDTFTYKINDAGMESTATVTVDVRDVSNVTLTAAKEATGTNSTGGVSSLPQSDQVIEEWDSFWVEVWLTADGTGGDTISAASATVHFDPTIYRASSLLIGPGFTAAAGSTTNNSSGIATIKATSTIDGLGGAQRVLLGRIRFSPVANGLSAPVLGETLGVDFSNFLTSVSDVSITVDGVGEVDSPTVDDTVATRLLPMIYDLDDDGRVSIGDFSDVVLAIGNRHTTAFVDFDLSGNPEESGLAYFMRAFGASYDGQSSGSYVSSAIYDAAISNAILTPLPSQSSSSSPITSETVEDFAVSLPAPMVTSGVGTDSHAVTIYVTELDGNQLAKTVGSVIYIDQDAAGWGWFVDQTPLDSSEYAAAGANGSLTALEGSEAAGRIDLLSVLMHELGHVAGLEHSEDGLMSSTILPGQRLIDWKTDSLDETFYIAAVDQFFSDDEG